MAFLQLCRKVFGSKKVISKINARKKKKKQYNIVSRKLWLAGRRERKLRMFRELAKKGL